MGLGINWLKVFRLLMLELKKVVLVGYFKLRILSSKKPENKGNLDLLSFFMILELLLYGVVLSLSGKEVVYDSHEDFPRAILGKDWIPHWLRKFSSVCSELVENACVGKFSAVVGSTPWITKRFDELTKKAENINGVSDSK